MEENRYFRFDEDVGDFVELLDRGPGRLVRLAALVAGLIVLVSVFL